LNLEDYESTKKSREIVKVILQYGVSQEDIVNIIKKLSLELEDANLMKNINNCINNEKISNNIENIQI
tara:strand:+ start:103 stop:306 length:204 start_codon:yes stop_codon:yes gene_type:complete